MKAKGLMVGDYIYLVDDFDGSKQVHKVTRVMDDVFDGDAIKVWEFTDWFGDEYIEPILITEEFLEKNGFLSVEEYNKRYTGGLDLSKYTHVMPWCENYFVAIAKVRDNCWNCHIQGDWAALDGGIGSVHELQHALKVCGIGKEIKV